MDELNALPYLDAVVRETMRMHGVVPFTNRRAMQDDVIPLAEPFIDKNGVVRTEIKYVVIHPESLVTYLLNTTG